MNELRQFHYKAITVKQVMIRLTNLSNKGRALIPTQMLLMSGETTAEMTVYRILTESCELLS